MAPPGSKHLTLENFTEFLPEDKAAKAFGLFEVTDQGQISKKALVQWVVSVYKERKALSLTLSDNRTVVAKLHRVMDVVRMLTLQFMHLFEFSENYIIRISEKNILELSFEEELTNLANFKLVLTSFL